MAFTISFGIIMINCLDLSAIFDNINNVFNKILGIHPVILPYFS